MLLSINLNFTLLLFYALNQEHQIFFYQERFYNSLMFALQLVYLQNLVLKCLKTNISIFI